MPFVARAPTEVSIHKDKGLRARSRGSLRGSSPSMATDQLPPDLTKASRQLISRRILRQVLQDNNIRGNNKHPGTCLDTATSRLSMANTIHTSPSSNRHIRIKLTALHPLNNGSSSSHHSNSISSSSTLSLAMLQALASSHMATISNQHRPLQEVLRKAMKGMGCDERALVRVFANHKYQNPWAFQQLRNDYESRFMRDLVKDVKGETRGDFEDALVALIRGPLGHDVYTLDKALDRAGTDEEALMDVLLCRSNADIRAIAAEYRHVKGKDLLTAIKDDVDDTLFRLYSMVLSAARAEDAAPALPADIDHKITELQRATEGIIGTNAIVVAQIFTSANAAQLRAMSIAYQQKYHRSLQDVIEREFRGDMEDALLRMLTSATEDGGKADADALRAPLLKTLQNKKIITYRVLRLYWGDRARLYAAQAAHQKFYNKTLTKELKESLSGDYENLMVALIGEK
ncbi:annexin A7 [Trichoderma asperellum]|uniref:Annexin A7 n=1 Tax=Trichoderma asperellum TaxID=101201 RepID=A0A6V8R413_TRIAP|nr:annexin A7 [Trichoderma asperellum]